MAPAPHPYILSPSLGVLECSWALQSPFFLILWVQGHSGGGPLPFSLISRVPPDLYLGMGVCNRSVVSMRSVVSDSAPPPAPRLDYGLLGSSVRGILQARILEQVAISSSRGSSRPRDQTRVSYTSPALQAASLPLSHHGTSWSWVTVSTSPLPPEGLTLKHWRHAASPTERQWRGPGFTAPHSLS